jgi:hypothetical protein
MATGLRLSIAALATSLVAALFGFAYEHPLDAHSVREAYFFGDRKDEKVAKFFAQYVKSLPVPKSGPHVAEIELRTPFQQAVLRASQAPGTYSAQQAEQDYRARPDLIVVRVRINLTPTYPGFIVDPSRGKGQLQERPEDFWRDYKVRVLQGSEVRPMRISGRALYKSGLDGPRVFGDAMLGAEVLLEFEPAQIRSEPVEIEVLTPDGQTVLVEFDLKELR